MLTFRQQFIEKSRSVVMTLHVFCKIYWQRLRTSFLSVNYIYVRNETMEDYEKL